MKVNGNLSVESRTVEQVPSSPYGNALWHEASCGVARGWVTPPDHVGQAKWHRAPTQQLWFCQPNGRWDLQRGVHDHGCWTARTFWPLWVLSGPQRLQEGACSIVAAPRSHLWDRTCMFSLSYFCVCVYRQVTPIPGAYLAVLQGLSGLQLCKQSACNWRPSLVKALRSAPVFRICGKINTPGKSPAQPKHLAHAGRSSDPSSSSRPHRRCSRRLQHSTGGLWVVWAELRGGTRAEAANPAIPRGLVLYLEAVSGYYSGTCVCIWARARAFQSRSKAAVGAG